ncbi:MAG: hypothetical protein HC907_36545 [Richelia sp. SM1_7_0]|nr:hypothetical protein [Richelia sp. SM1_7_0]
MSKIKFHVKDELGFCTRLNDGVSGMTVTALADFCGTLQQAITQLLNRIRDSSPIMNELPESLKSFAGEEWRLITNNEQNSLFVVDELCHAILEYYAIDARKYKGKQVAINNYRMVARAGLRVFIWSQTGYSPYTLNQEQLALLNSIPRLQEAITQLQSQIQNLLPASKANYIPPGWNAELWNKLPLQDKRHFRFLHRRRGFRPDYRTEVPLEELTEQFKQKQKDELKTAVVEVSPEEKQRLEALRLEALKLLREEGVEND